MANVVIDINKLIPVVDANDWHEKIKSDVQTKSVKLVVGGSKQKTEIAKVTRVKKWILQLERAGRIVSVLDEQIDELEKGFTDELPPGCTECDDPHLFAICQVSGSGYLISNDNRITRCRDRVKKIVKLKVFCRFKFIHDERRYDSHRHKITS